MAHFQEPNAGELVIYADPFMKISVTEGTSGKRQIVLAVSDAGGQTPLSAVGCDILVNALRTAQREVGDSAPLPAHTNARPDSAWGRERRPVYAFPLRLQDDGLIMVRRNNEWRWIVDFCREGRFKFKGPAQQDGAIWGFFERDWEGL